MALAAALSATPAPPRRGGPTLELHVESGSRAGLRARFAGEHPVVVGRDPGADLRLDAGADLDASARHLELRLHDVSWRLRDLGSTNGTWVNGRRIAGDAVVRDGDRIRCGADGPSIVARLVTAAGTPAPTRRTRVVVAAALLVTIAAGAAGGGAAVERRADARVQAADSLRRAAEGARRASLRDVRALQARLVADSVRRAAPAAPTPVTLAPAAHAVTRASRAAMAAVALVAVEAADGTTASGTAFGLTAGGLLVTSRHVVMGRDGLPPRRVAVKYADTDGWLEARLVRAHADADLATVQVVADGRYPVVARVADAPPAVGAEIAVVGFPASAEASGERALADGIVRAAVFRGYVGKVADGLLVVDAFAGYGSSGSPVLDARGAVVGVVYGGPVDAAGRVAYAVPGAALRALLR